MTDVLGIKLFVTFGEPQYNQQHGENPCYSFGEDV